MSKIEEIITQNASDFNTCFVFPSSVCAKEWMIAALDITPYNSLPADMFIAWDDFKKEYFIGKGKPISTNTKKLFVNKLLENKRD